MNVKSRGVSDVGQKVVESVKVLKEHFVPTANIPF